MSEGVGGDNVGGGVCRWEKRKMCKVMVGLIWYFFR